MHSNGPVLDDEILADPEVQASIRDEGSVQRSYDITNVDRAAFGRVGGAVARLHGDSGFAGTLAFDLQVWGRPLVLEARQEGACAKSACEKFSQFCWP